MTAIGCTCDEMRYEETQPATSGKGKTVEYTGRTIRLRPEDVPLHNCAYVQARNKLIPLAWHIAGQRARNEDQRCVIFHQEMNRLGLELVRKGLV